MAKTFKVIKDTREKKGYYFTASDKGLCDGMVEQTLTTGDYTIVGLEDQVCIERKASVEELAINLGQKRDAFNAEIERMESFPHKFLILEFDMEAVMKFPNHENSRIPESKRDSVSISSRFIMKKLVEFQTHRNIKVLFCGGRRNGFMTVTSIFKRIIELYSGERQNR